MRLYLALSLSGRESGLFFLLLSSGLLGLGLSGCSINPKVDLPSLVSSNTPVLLEAPFFPQTEYQCGPAALATVLVASGVETTPDTLTPQVYLPDRQGSLQLELLAATRRAGRIPYVIENDLAMLFSEVESGRPVLLLQNLQTQQFPVWHYAVLVGFDAASEQVYLNTGTLQNEAMSARKFARLWDWAGNWALVVLKPGEIPRTAQYGTYFQSVANFEAVAGSSAAEPAWRAALLQWPDQAPPFLALGNLAYAQGHQGQAAALYQQGLKLDENDMGLINNLATVLGELGCPREGERLLQARAAHLQSESAWSEIVNTTLSELEASSPSQTGDCKKWGVESESK